MAEERIGHLLKLPIGSVKQKIEAKPLVPCLPTEVSEILKDLYAAVDDGSYIPQTPTEYNPSLSDE